MVPVSDRPPLPVTSSASRAPRPLAQTIARHSVGMGIATGVLVRAYRALVLGFDASAEWALFLAAVLGGVVFACALLTWHLSHFAPHRWMRRTAWFIGAEVSAELLASLAFVAIGVERIGSAVATWSDVPAVALQTLLERGLLFGGYALALSIAVRVVTTRSREPVIEEEGEDAEAAGADGSAPPRG